MHGFVGTRRICITSEATVRSVPRMSNDSASGVCSAHIVIDLCGSLVSCYVAGPLDQPESRIRNVIGEQEG